MQKTRRLRKVQDKRTRAIYRSLQKHFRCVAGRIEDVVYRYNSASIWIKIVDPQLKCMSPFERIDMVYERLSGDVPDSVTGLISLMVLRTPDEIANEGERDLFLKDFEDPDRSDN
jgi:hypothetical protein